MSDNVIPEETPYNVRKAFHDEILAILHEAVGGKIRHEEFEPRSRNVVQRLMDRHYMHPYSFYLEHHAHYKLVCKEVLRVIEPVIHQAVGDMVRDMVRELDADLLGPASVVAGPLPPVPDDASRVPNNADSDLLNATTNTSLGIPARSRSPSPEQEPRANSGQPSVPNPAPSVTEAGSPVHTSNPFQSQRKRPAPPQDEGPSHRPQKKRAKKAPKIKREIRSAKDDECVFWYKDYPGFYVLRCDRNACKKEAGVADNEPVCFHTDPFKGLKMWRHFTKAGHRLRKTNEHEVFLKFAVRVTDAIAPRNLNGPEPSSDRQPPPPSTRRAQTPAPLQTQQQPLSPVSITQDKGKQPERAIAGRRLRSPIEFRSEVMDCYNNITTLTSNNETATLLGDPDPPRVSFSSTSRTASSSASATATATASSSTASKPGATKEDQKSTDPFARDSEIDSEEEFPRIENLKNGTRQKARVDYREKPPRYGEFEFEFE